MQNSVWAMFGHMIADDSLPLHEQHHPCPRDSDLFILLSFDNIKLRNFNCVFLKITIQGFYRLVTAISTQPFALNTSNCDCD